jgi:hypothetical protein
MSTIITHTRSSGTQRRTVNTPHLSKTAHSTPRKWVCNHLTALTVLSVMVSGCSMFGNNDPVVVASTPSSVAIRFQQGDLPAAEARAASMCQQYGRVSRLETTTPSRGKNSIANFDCR